MFPGNFHLSLPRFDHEPVLKLLLESPPAPLTSLSYYWNGLPADASFKTDVWLGWTPQAIYGLFTCSYLELNITQAPDLHQKTMGLWERDVVEIFIAPDPGTPGHYYELEVSPLGEWLDVELVVNNNQRHSNWEWQSGIQTIARTGAPPHLSPHRVWQAALRVPALNLFGKELEIGQQCLANLYRCDGSEPRRNYFAWSPTLTETPNFHVPDSFGRFTLAGTSFCA